MCVCVSRREGEGGGGQEGKGVSMCVCVHSTYLEALETVSGAKGIKFVFGAHLEGKGGVDVSAVCVVYMYVE